MRQQIVDALLSKFKKPSEIKKIINYLSDNDNRNSILEKLEFSIDQPVLKTEKKKKKGPKRKKETPDTYLIDRICKILRNELLMSNVEVENWFKNKYGIQKNIGRSGLRTYLMQIMKSEGNEFSRKVLTDLSLMMHDQGKKDKELEMWWNESENIKASRFLDGVKKHINDLKDFFLKWKSVLPAVPSSEELPFDDESLNKDISINQIERDLLFKDVEIHLPVGYETLLDDWRKYKELLNEYINEYRNIVDKIKNEIWGEGFSPESIYTRSVNLLKKGHRWDYHKWKVSQNQHMLNYGISYGGSDVEKGFNLVEKGTDEEVKKREEHHKMFSDKIRFKYEVEIKKLIKNEIELNKRRLCLLELLEHLGNFPDFPNADQCNIIKQIFINNY